MDEEKKEREKFRITSNIVQKKKLFDRIPYRNIIEGALISIIVIFIINIIPFKAKFKIVASLVYMAVIMIFCCNGLYGRCVTDALKDYIKYRRNRKQLHLGDMNDERKYNTKFKRGANQSYAERAVEVVRNKYKEIKERISNEQ